MCGECVHANPRNTKAPQAIQCARFPTQGAPSQREGVQPPPKGWQSLGKRPHWPCTPAQAAHNHHKAHPHRHSTSNTGSLHQPTQATNHQRKAPQRRHPTTNTGPATTSIPQPTPARSTNQHKAPITNARRPNASTPQPAQGPPPQACHNQHKDHTQHPKGSPQGLCKLPMCVQASPRQPQGAPRHHKDPLTTQGAPRQRKRSHACLHKGHQAFPQGTAKPRPAPAFTHARQHKRPPSNARPTNAQAPHTHSQHMAHRHKAPRAQPPQQQKHHQHQRQHTSPNCNTRPTNARAPRHHKGLQGTSLEQRQGDITRGP